MTEFIIDTHAHLDSRRFDRDRQAIIDNFEKDKIKAMINIGFDLESSIRGVELAKANERVYAMVGTHPHDAKTYTDEVENTYRELAKEDKVVAIGEIGLDYYRDLSPREVQKEVFIRQINLAKELDLPIIIHSRDAFEDVYEILSTHAQGMKVLLHAFSESWEVCQRYLKLGFKMALGGVVTFQNAKKTIRVAENIPLDALMLETDAPYLTPHPYRGKRNEPKYIHFVADKIAEIKCIPVEELKEAAYKNTVEFFNLDI